MNRTLSVLVCAAASAAAPLVASAQGYPAKPITLLSGASVGSVGDIGVRTVVARMAEGLGKPIVVEARRGAGGLEAFATAAKAEPNGYTLLFANVGLVTNKFLRREWLVDAVKDYTHIVQLFSSPYFLAATASVPVNSMKELIDYAKQNPGKLTYASTGVGSGAHLQGEAINLAAGTKMLHVPYTGNNASMAVNDLIAGRVDLYISDLNAFAQHVPTGKIKLIGFVDKTRSRLRPEVQTVNEVVPDAYNIVVWWGILGPANMPRALVERINAESGKALSEPGLLAKMSSLTVVPPSPNAPEEFARQIRSDVEHLSNLVAALGLKPD